MRLILEGGQRIRLLATGPGLDIESADPAVQFSPLHMLAASLATCTLSVLAGWARQARLDLTGLEIGLEWEYYENPFRVGRYAMTLRWPALPEERKAAALRVAEHCTVEQTLKVPPEIELRIET